MASNSYTVTFTGLELEGLLIWATGGIIDDSDAVLGIAAAKAVEKLERAQSGNRPPRAPQRQGRGKRLDMGWGKPAA